MIQFPEKCDFFLIKSRKLVFLTSKIGKIWNKPFWNKLKKRWKLDSESIKFEKL